MNNQIAYFIVDTHPENLASRRMPTAFPSLLHAVNALGFLRRYHQHPECLSIAQTTDSVSDAVTEQANVTFRH